MNLTDLIKTSEEVRQYWTSLLGEELLQKMLDAPDHFVPETKMVSDAQWAQWMQFIAERPVFDGNQKINHTGCFEPFSEYLKCYTMKILSTAIGKEASEQLLENLSLQISEKLSWLGIRCLMNEMHLVKQEGKLKGEDSVEEYEDYLKSYLASSGYMTAFFEKYPVLGELMIFKVDAYGNYIRDLMHHLQDDQKEIIDKLCHGQPFEKVVEIKLNLSDEHIPGHSVARLVLDNGVVLYHKPHDLTTSVNYQKWYQWLLGHCEMDSIEYPIVNRVQYGWEAEIEPQPCLTEEEVASFYKRTGIQACLAYVTGMTDIHFENIIAHGQYPVIVDMEFIADRRWRPADDPKTFREMLRDTVLNTGILPVSAWNDRNQNFGGLGENKEQRASVQLPMVVNKGTSDMAIAYGYPKIDVFKNLPELEGEKKDFKAYIVQIMDGFEKAYRVMMAEKEEFEESFKKDFEVRSRYLLRNTQEYFMYQNTMNFPVFMADAESRKMMTAHMDKGLFCNEKFRDKVLEYERDCVYRAIVPVFYADGKDLHTGSGVVLKDYFAVNGEYQILHRLHQLSENDLRFQISVMETDFLFYARLQPGWTGKIYSGTARVSELTPKKIADKLIEEMRTSGEACEWLTVQYHPSGRTYLRLVDLYLYNGLCGMAIFFAALCRLYPDEKYLKISDQVIRQLFAHTDQMEAGKVKAERWGLFTGEASFVYTYHILYKLTGNTIYVKYEKKHANWLTDCITEIDGYDIIDGKAGVLAALVCLYEDTDDGQYIETAKCVAKELLGQAQSMQAGIGWPHKDRPALAGMAHGNSGIALALAMLWKQTGEDILWTTIEKAIAYEDSLYDFTFENWMDIRDIHHKDGKPQSMIAWCHGLAGIMAARLKIHTLTGMSLDTLFGTVIHADENGEISFNKMTEKIINSQKREMCLCHGALGLEMLVGRPVGENDVLSFEDWNSPGMMTGLAGIGYAMLCRKDPLLPSILLLD